MIFATDLAHSILQARNEAEARGAPPTVLILDRCTHETLSRSEFGGWSGARPVLFGLQVEVDIKAEGWTLV
ncbi:hypothetical protein [Rubellimicrobium arenae]|uniref:hypothetical protein n=1 Tax=Rubellimicrobium arenae TaxID=2817372 RepID=UPI001B307864|nr:hypothetical protein [Rubellimicrobium arenae]